jgi:hypothetical protein
MHRDPLSIDKEAVFNEIPTFMSRIPPCRAVEDVVSE